MIARWLVGRWNPGPAFHKRFVIRIFDNVFHILGFLLATVQELREASVEMTVSPRFRTLGLLIWAAVLPLMAAAARPNVLFIMGDDHTTQAFGCLRLESIMHIIRPVSRRSLARSACFQLVRCLCLVLLTGSVVWGAGPMGPAVTKVRASSVDVGMTIKGKWGTFINGKSYQQSPLSTCKGWQYATYYDQGGRLSIARRRLPGGAWQVIRFADYVFKGNDNHNVTVLGICRNDGTIHLAFDHHCEPLHYRVSKPGVASNPETVAWEASLFSEVRNGLQPGERIRSVTYPRFLGSPDGGLLFFSRDGVPVNGRVTLSIYRPASGGWSERRRITSGKGSYDFEGRTRTGRYAYLNGVGYDQKSGRLHLSWCWREEGVLSIYMQKDPAEAMQATELQVIDFKVSGRGLLRETNEIPGTSPTD